MLAGRIDAEIFDADAEARMLLEGNPEVREAVMREISTAAYDENGKPDRAEIRRVIFADPCAKARLEEVLHPRVRERWMSLAAEKRKPTDRCWWIFHCCLKTIWNRILCR